MRLHLVLPTVEPTNVTLPETCPHDGCPGRHFQYHQTVDKPLRDTVYRRLQIERYKCLRCQRTFRVYPQGVTRAPTSQRVKGLAVMLYLLGLSYGATSLVLAALGVPLCKSRVYDIVQAAAEKVPGLKRESVFEDIQTPALGADITSVKCKGEWLPIGLAVNDLTGLVLTVDELSAEDAATLQEWLAPIVAAVGAEVLVTDDADAFKTVADEEGLEQQVCKGHVVRNTEALIQNLKDIVTTDADGSLAAIGVSPEQAVQDLERLGELIQRRQPEDEAELEQLPRRYMAAAPPGKGERASAAYRTRLLFLDRWTLWRRLTLYRTWQSLQGETLDGTNNACERAIGWWIKERYRTMRGYKRRRSAINISRLLAWCGNHLDRGGVDLTALVA
jgi:transposase-like protein